MAKRIPVLMAGSAPASLSFRDFLWSLLAVSGLLLLLELLYALHPGIVPEEAMVYRNTGLLRVHLPYQPMVRWDAAWYNHIALRGYGISASAAFFPLFPLLLRALVSVGMPLTVADVLLPALCTAALLPLLYAVFRSYLGRPEAAMGIVFLAAYPPSFFLLAAYPMSLYLLLVVAVFYFSGRDRYLPASACAFLAALSWNLGALLSPAFAYRWWRSRRAGDLLVAVGPVLAMGIYCGFLAWRFGNPWEFSAVVPKVWGRKGMWPFVPMGMAVAKAFTGFGLTGVTMWDILAVALMTCAILLGHRRLPAEMRIYSILTLLVIAGTGIPRSSDPMISDARFALALFPLFGIVGVALGWIRGRRRGKLLVSLLLGALGVLNLSFYWLFSHGKMVG